MHRAARPCATRAVVSTTGARSSSDSACCVTEWQATPPPLSASLTLRSHPALGVPRAILVGMPCALAGGGALAGCGHHRSRG